MMEQFLHFLVGVKVIILKLTAHGLIIHVNSLGPMCSMGNTEFTYAETRHGELEQRVYLEVIPQCLLFSEHIKKPFA